MHSRSSLKLSLELMYAATNSFLLNSYFSKKLSCCSLCILYTTKPSKVLWLEDVSFGNKVWFHLILWGKLNRPNLLASFTILCLFKTGCGLHRGTFTSPFLINNTPQLLLLFPTSTDHCSCKSNTVVKTLCRNINLFCISASDVVYGLVCDGWRGASTQRDSTGVAHAPASAGKTKQRTTLTSTMGRREDGGGPGPDTGRYRLALLLTASLLYTLRNRQQVLPHIFRQY